MQNIKNNNNSEIILLNRTISNFPLISIGTGLALETLFMPESGYFDPTRVIDYKVRDNEFKTVYINIYTILRNIVSAISTTDEKHIFLDTKDSDSAIVSVFLEEYSEIERLLLEKHYNPILYIIDYNKNKFIANTDRNILKIEGDTLSAKTNMFISKASRRIRKEYYPNLLESMKNNIKSIETKISTSYLSYIVEKLKEGNKLPLVVTGKNLIISHFAVDLLNIKYVSNLSLLESHTGRIISSKDFNRKFPDLSNLDFTKVIPFTEKLYYIFGDGNLLKPANAKFRKQIYELFVKNGINPTTKATSIDSLMTRNEKSLDNELVELFKNLVTNY